MDRVVLESLNKIRDLESKEVLTEATAVAAPAAQAASKGIGRFIPGVGAALGAYDAYNRAKQGDWAGAGISALGGAAALIPGVGTAASLGLAGAQALRDKQRTGSYLPGDDEIAAAVAKDKEAQTASPQVPAGGDPKVFALQQQLIAKGAKITADGKMGPQTQAAMKQFPDVKMAEDNEENKMSESQRIAELMNRLAQLEQAQPQVADEGVGDLLAKGAAKAGNAWQKFKTGISNPRSTNLPSGQNAAQKTGAAIAQNPGKVAAGAAAAGALGTAAMMGGAGTKPAEPAKPAAPAKKPATGAGAKPAAAASALTTDEEGEMGVLAQELGAHMGRVPELDALLLQYEKLRPGAANAAP